MFCHSLVVRHGLLLAIQEGWGCSVFQLMVLLLVTAAADTNTTATAPTNTTSVAVTAVSLLESIMLTL